MSEKNYPLTLCLQPNPLACGQAVLAMLCKKSVDEIIAVSGTKRETKLSDMNRVLQIYGFPPLEARRAVTDKKDLSPVCVLSLETPKCWHWSLYCDGIFYDPEYGILSDFPESARKYCFPCSFHP